MFLKLFLDEERAQDLFINGCRLSDDGGKRKIILIQLLDKKPDIKLLNLSVSKAKTFKDCAKKFKFTYIDKLPRKEWDFHVFGKYCHLVLELFHTELIKNPDLCCTNLFSECQDKALEIWGSKLTPDQKQLAYDVLQNYLNNWIDKRCSFTLLKRSAPPPTTVPPTTIPDSPTPTPPLAGDYVKDNIVNYQDLNYVITIFPVLKIADYTNIVREYGVSR
jgi:hypothetical protein